MTVAELIEQLQKLPQDHKVYVFDWEYCNYDELEVELIDKDEPTNRMGRRTLVKLQHPFVSIQ